MHNRVTIEDIPRMPIDEIAALPPDQLVLLTDEAAEALERARRVKDRLDGALDLKYGARACAARVAGGKATGTVRIQDGTFVVIADLPKRVKWDQTRLAEAVEIIRRDWNDDPTAVRPDRTEGCRDSVRIVAGGHPPAFRAGAHRRDRQANLPHRAGEGGGGVMAISLASLKRTTALAAPRILIHGVAGVGKTTFAAGAPKPVFIQTEDGLGTLEVPHFPLARTFDEVMEALAALYTEATTSRPW